MTVKGEELETGLKKKKRKEIKTDDGEDMGVDCECRSCPSMSSRAG